jgi:hypothetical protein
MTPTSKPGARKTAGQRRDGRAATLDALIEEATVDAYDESQQSRIADNGFMDVQVFAPPELAGEAKRFLAPFQVNPIVSSVRSVEDEPLHGERFLLYLSGQEDDKQLSKSLRALARQKRRIRTLVLYPRKADHRRIVGWARVAELLAPVSDRSRPPA